MARRQPRTRISDKPRSRAGLVRKIRQYLDDRLGLHDISVDDDSLLVELLIYHDLHQVTSVPRLGEDLDALLGSESDLGNLAEQVSKLAGAVEGLRTVFYAAGSDDPKAAAAHVARIAFL